MFLYKNTKNINGFTLMETMVTIGIFSILALGTSALMKDIITNTRQENFSIENADRSRFAAFNFINEIRSASIGVDGSYPITQASSSQIIFYSSYGNKNSLVNKIRYFISDSKLKKSVIEPSGNPLAYNPSSEIITTVATDIKNDSTPLFYYYNSDYDGNYPPLNQPVNINSIRYVKINMIILKQNSRNSTDTFNINAGSSIRNLKTNLGS
jgi:prepilin-type N-terminal cleavage/methylation domain-containing protein